MPSPRIICPQPLPEPSFGTSCQHLSSSEKRTLPDWVHAPPDDLDRSRSRSASEDPAYLTIREAAAYLRVSTRTVQRQVKKGDLRVVRIGRSVRIERAELKRFAGSKILFLSSVLEECRD